MVANKDHSGYGNYAKGTTESWMKKLNKKGWFPSEGALEPSKWQRTTQMLKNKRRHKDLPLVPQAKTVWEEANPKADLAVAPHRRREPREPLPDPQRHRSRGVG